MIRIHITSASSATAVVAAIEETGERYEVIRSDRPGVGPSLDDGVVHLSGTAAILLWLGDRFPERRLVPLVGDPDRPRVFTWVTWLANTVQTAVARLDPTSGPPVGDDLAATMRTAAVDDLAAAFDFVDAELAGRTVLVGTRCTVADLYLHMLTAASRVDGRDAPALRPALAAHREMVEALPSVVRMRQRLI